MCVCVCERENAYVRASEHVSFTRVGEEHIPLRDVNNNNNNHNNNYTAYLREGPF
jgi:hypothetical protein